MEKQIVWMKVTSDKYELPVAVADSIAELARMVGKKPNNISSSMSHAKIKGQRSPYRKIEVEDD